MTNMTAKLRSPEPHTARRRNGERGIALITVLFLLIIMTILGLTMIVSVNSDMLINGYYGNSRAAYYAADSGLNVARQYLTNQLQASVSTHKCLGWGPAAAALDAACVAAPLNSVTAPQSALTNLKAAFATFSSGSIYNTGTTLASQPSWPSSFIVQDSSTCTSSFQDAANSPVPTYGTVNGVANLITNYLYSFNYVLCSTGTGSGSTGTGSATQRSVVKEVGVLQLNVNATNLPAPSFAGYGQFVANQQICPGAYLTPGTYTGPSFTNGSWTLGNTGPYIFTNPLMQVGADIGYYVGSNCTQSTSSSFNGISATFQQGLTLGATAKPLPGDSYSQKFAVLDGLGTNTYTTAQMGQYLKDVNGGAYTGSSGVYLPYNSSTGAYGGVNGVGGGIYVEGNAAILLTPGTDTSNNPTQIYTITQGSTVTTVTIDPGKNSTTIVAGTKTTSLSGVPQNLANPLLPAVATPTMLYVDGSITGLTGPGEQQAAIQNNFMVTVAALNNVSITGDLVYATEPVTKSTADTMLLPTTETSNSACPNCFQTLGVFTANGTINLNSPYSDHNIETDGALAAIGSSCPNNSCGFTNTGTINTWNNVGGQIQSNQFVCSIQTANTYYDQRFSQWQNIGFAPPWFPSTSTTGNYVAAAPIDTPTQQRTSWVWIAQQ
jgi:Tfp pilus assembly protein PilX